MNKKGFTLVELLATIVILGILFGITLVLVNGGFGNAKEKSEDVFVKTISDALDIYIDTDARKLHFDSEPVCYIDKTHGKSNVYAAVDSGITFNNVINSSYSPITLNDLHNPANKNKEHYECSATGRLYIYRDDDYVYYYKINKGSFECLNQNTNEDITNLPECKRIPG